MRLGISRKLNYCEAIRNHITPKLEISIESDPIDSQT